MNSLVKIVFPLFAGWKAFWALFNALKYEHAPSSTWAWVAFSVLLFAFSIAVVFNQKWGWTFSVSLLTFRLCVAGVYLGLLTFSSWLSDYPKVRQILLKDHGVAAACSFVILLMLFAARQNFKSPSSAPESRESFRSYVKPVASGFALLLAGLCALWMPSGDASNLAPIGFVFLTIIWLCSVLCHLELFNSKTKYLTLWTAFLPLLGLAVNVSGSGFARGTLIFGATQSVLSLIAFAVICKIQRSNSAPETGQPLTGFPLKVAVLSLIILTTSGGVAYWYLFVRLQAIRWAHQLHYPDGAQVIVITDYRGSRGAPLNRIIPGGKYIVRGEYNFSRANGDMSEAGIVFGFRAQKNDVFVPFATFQVPHRQSTGKFEIFVDTIKFKGDMGLVSPECRTFAYGGRLAGRSVLEN
jgi:hypothetical protein